MMLVPAGRKLGGVAGRRPVTRRRMPLLMPVTRGYYLHHLYLTFAITIRRRCSHGPMADQKIRKIAAAVLMIGGLAVAGQASARNGADVVGALIGGAVLGAVVSSAPAGPYGYAPPPEPDW